MLTHRESTEVSKSPHAHCGFLPFTLSSISYPGFSAQRHFINGTLMQSVGGITQGVDELPDTNIEEGSISYFEMPV